MNIKLGIIKQHLKTLDKDGHCFTFLCSAFHGLCEEKLKARIFDSPKICKMTRGKDFMVSMDIIEESTWHVSVEVVHNFLGNVKPDNYMEIVDELYSSFQLHCCDISIKIHFIFSHLGKFPENHGDVSDKQGECFHQDIEIVEECYQRRWDIHIMADYC